MESKLFSIGDIVALKTHPYFEGNAEVIISGDHLGLSPLMVIIEIYKSKQRFAGVKTDIFKYRCTWFSPKSYKFITAIKDAFVTSSFIRIKYKSRNEQLSHRTLKNYEIIEVKKGL